MSAPGLVGEYDGEPVKGLPEELPEGEELLWQGSPDWRSLARSAFHTRGVAVYFGILVAWRIVAALGEGRGALEALGASVWLVALGIAAVGLLTLLAWLNARAAVYTLTSRRVVLRFGVALEMAVNLPFERIESAAFRDHGDGTGDIPLRVGGAGQIGYAMLWPYARPWRLGSRVEPMLRAVPEAGKVAGMLTRALESHAGRVPSVRSEAETRDATAPGMAAAAS